MLLDTSIYSLQRVITPVARKLFCIVANALLVAIIPGMALATTASFEQDASAQDIVSVEAESYHGSTISPDGHAWLSAGTSFPGHSGSDALQALPEDSVSHATDYTSLSPRLDFQVNFVTTGTHYVWIRALGPSPSSNDLHVGLDGQALVTGNNMKVSFNQGYKWQKRNGGGKRATVEIMTPGVHEINVWMRESGMVFDKLVLTTDSGYDPETINGGSGPNESALSATVAVEKPQITPNGGVFSDAVQITLSSITSGATIYYTIDGSDPTTGSNLYTAPFFLNQTATLKARAFLTGQLDSAIDSAYFQIKPEPSGMERYWKFNELVGPTFTDTITAATADCTSCPTATGGRVSGAQLYDGIDDEVNIAGVVPFDWANTDRFSLEAWVNKSTACPGNEVIIGRHEASGMLHWLLGCENNNAVFTLTDTNAVGATISGTTNITDGQWHHLVAVRDAVNGDIRLYVDGVEEASAPVSYTGNFAGTASVNIGWLNDGATDHHFEGAIDEIALHSRVLSLSDISRHYNDGSIGLRRGYWGCDAPVRLMPLGDSITDAVGLGGYRDNLYHSLVSAGYDVNFVGSRSDGVGTHDPHHEGHGGYTASDIAASLNSWLSDNPPDTILLHIGTNEDPAYSYPSTGGVENLHNIIEAFNSDIAVVQAQIINRVPNEPLVTQFNNNIASMVATRAASGENIAIANHEYALNYVDDMNNDGIHPLPAGYDKMSPVWHEQLVTFLPACNQTLPNTISQPVTTAQVGVPYLYQLETEGFPNPDFSLPTAPGGMTIHPDTGRIEWTPAATGTFNVSVQVQNAAGSTTHDFTVSVSAAPSADLEVGLGVDDPSPPEGGNVVFTLTVTNMGPADATGVEIEKLLPAGLSYLSDDSASTATFYDEGTGIWIIGTLENSATISLNITATVDAGASLNPLNNTASVKSLNELDPVSNNNSASIYLFDYEWPSLGWTVTGPAAVNMDQVKLEQARDYALTGGGSGYIIRHGKLAFSWGDATLRYDLESTTKSIAVSALGLALQDELVNLNDLAKVHYADIGNPPISNTTTGWLDEISLTHLSTHAAGFDRGPGFVDQLFQPGTIWSYSNGGTNWLADTLTVVFGQDLKTLLFDRVFTPLGITAADLTWRNSLRTPTVNGITSREFSSGISANVDAMARIGYLYLRNGRWEAQSILPDSFVSQAGNPVPAIQGLPVNNPSQHFSASNHYGLMWWNNGDGTIAGVPEDTFWSWGLDDSLIVVIPSLDIVVARAGSGWRTGWNSDYTVVHPFILPIVQSATDALDLSVSMAVDEPAPLEGGTVVYTVSVTNNGPSAASGVVLTDLLPAGLTYVGDDATSSGTTYDSGTGAWTVGAVLASQTVSLQLTAGVDAGTGGTTLTNTASVSGLVETDPVSGNDSASVDVTVVSSADLAVGLLVDEPAPLEGGTVVYTVSVTNNGPSAASGVALTDLLPAGLTYVSDDAGSTSTTYDSGTGAWSVGAVAVSQTVSLQLTASVDAGTGGTTLTNTASVSGLVETDPVSGNDSASVDVTVVSSADLAVGVVVDEPAPLEGGSVVYTVSVTNNGPSAASGVALTDLLPAGLTYVGDDATSSGTTYDSGTGAWTVGAVLASQTVSLQLTASVDAGTGGTTLTNTASVSGLVETDPVSGNDSASVDVTVVSSADLAVGVVVDEPAPLEGGSVVYTVSVTNNGPSAASGVALTDLLPAGLTYVGDDATSSGTTYDSGTGAWTVGAVLASQTVSLQLTASVDAGTGGTTLTNTASVSGLVETDPVSGNDSASVDVTVLVSVDLAVGVVVDEPAPLEGGSVVYTVSVTNNGPSAASGVALTDLLPAGLTYVGDDATSSGTTYDSGTGAWSVGAVLASQTVSLQLTASVDAGTGGTTLTNTASVSGLVETDPVSGNDSASVDVTVLVSVDLAVGVVVDEPAPLEGGSVVYTVSVTNNGPSAASGVALTDLLPAGLTYVGDDATSSGTTYDSGTGAWSVGAVLASQTVSLQLTASVDAGTGGTTLTNTASVSGLVETDPVSGNDSASMDVTVVSSYISDGDINGDGIVNAGDILLAQRILLGLYVPTASEFQRGDVAPLVGGIPSPDGLFNAGDVLLIQRKAIGDINF